MSRQDKGGLGKGLGALLPKVSVTPAKMEVSDSNVVDIKTAESDTVSADVKELAAATKTQAPPTAVVRQLEIGSIKPNPRQPRKSFDDASLDDLASSIREVGVLQPIVVRTNNEGALELVAGERRLRASLRAGRSTVPAIVRDDNDEWSLLSAFIENVQRVDLNPLEEAAGYRTLIDDLGVTHEEVARRVGKARATVTNSLRLLTLAAEVQRRVVTGELSSAHARTIAALSDPDQQIGAAQRVITDSLSVRATEVLVKEIGSKKPLTEHAVKTRAAHEAKRAERPAGVVEAESMLADWLDTSVRVEQSASGRGRIVIEYAGASDLNRLVGRIASKSPSEVG